MIDHPDFRENPMLDQVTVVQAIAQLEARLTTLINTAVTSLSQQLHESILAQERRNATFADRERVEAVARNAHDANNQIAVNNLRLTKIETALNDLANRSQAAVMTGLGWVITAAIVFGSVVFTFILTHVVTK